MVPKVVLRYAADNSSDLDSDFYDSSSRPSSPASSETTLATPPNELDIDLKTYFPPSMADSAELDKLIERRSAYPDFYPPLPKVKVLDTVSPLDKGTADAWVKRDERQVRLTGKHPFNSEVPLDVLFDAGFLTPAELFYTRSHGAIPKIEGEVLENWTVSIGGLVKNELKLTLQDLKTKFETVSLPITIACAGNRRREQNVVRKGLGFNWGAAAVSTGLFTGVYLADILALAQPTVSARKGHVIFEGYDFDLPQGPYGTSQRLDRGTDRKHGILLAWAVNGLPLEPDHGFPLRVVVPGVVGGRSVKWLHKIEIADHGSTHHLHLYDNKVLPTQLSPEQARAETHWWYDEKYEIKELSVNSAIARPAHNEILSLSSSEIFTCKGYAYSGGGRRITRVEITLDEGATWTLGKINYFEDQFRELAYRDPLYGTIDLTDTNRCFAWCFWEFEFPMSKLRDISSIAVRATDDALASQPRDMYWNPTGMMNNWWFRTAVFQESNDTIRFEHPTIAGNTPGGWMQSQKDEGRDILNPTFQSKVKELVAEIPAEVVTEIVPESSSKPSTEFAPASAPRVMPILKAVVTPVKPVKKRFEWINPEVTRVITQEELEQHNTAQNTWFVVEGEVYDPMRFLDQHPGGAESITIMAGEDATEDFMAIHSPDALRQLIDYHIGTLETGNESEAPTPLASAAPAVPVEQVAPTPPTVPVAPKAPVIPEVVTTPAVVVAPVISAPEVVAVPEVAPALTVKEVVRASDSAFLAKKHWKGAKLISIQSVNHDSSVYRFALDREDQPIGLPIGMHVYMRLRRKPRVATTIPGTEVVCTPYPGGDLVQRSYTPVSMPGATGHIDVLIKHYPPTPAHPSGGKFTCALSQVEVGETVEFKGPMGEFTWAGNGIARWKSVDLKIRNIGMIAAGSGITPILQVLRGIFLNQDDYDETRVWVLDANRTEKDILCRSELDAFVYTARGRMKLHHTLSPLPKQPSGLFSFLAPPSKDPTPYWGHSRGHIDMHMMKKHLPPPSFGSLILICGPDGLIESTCKPGLAMLGWDIASQVVVF